MLLTLAILLGAAVVLVPLSRRLGFGSVLGYLVGGALIGPSGLGLVTDVQDIADVSELGVVMLLFLIGLEVRPQRLWVMRRAVFGLGGAQLVLSAAVLALPIHLAGINWTAATVLGLGLAMSSTAIVLPILAERNLLATTAGRDTFSVLLFQDLAFVPLVALLPLFAGGEIPNRVPWHDVAVALGAVAVILVGGRYLIRPAFRAIGGARTQEVFTALALFLVVGTAALASFAGLSMSLGAFLAGVLISDSEYRHEVQATIEPFEGLLLGFFFLSIGMAANLGMAVAAPVPIAVAVLGLVLLKAAVAFGIGRAAGQRTRTALRFALALPQGSEFSFVLFSIGVAQQALAQDIADRATLVIALSMAASPLLFAAGERFLVPLLLRETHRPDDVVEAGDAEVIICGFGRVGQIIGRVLLLRGIKFTALDRDPAQVEVVRRFGGTVFYGHMTRPELLRAAGAERAKVLVLAIDDVEESMEVAGMVRRIFPGLRILARARNRVHAHRLMELGVDAQVRETFFSSLRIGELTLQALGVPEAEAHRAVALFRRYDEANLAASQSYYTDEQKLIQNAQQVASELAGLLESDRDALQAEDAARRGAEAARV